MTGSGGGGPRTDRAVRGFASDNYSGIHAEVLAAIASANVGHETAYGDDVHTERLQDIFRDHFGARASAFPVFNGTGANVVGLQAMTSRWASVVCTTTAHIYVDEGGAPEKVCGLKLVPVATADGKLTPDLLDVEARGFGDIHRAQPQVVSVTQTTELGTAYSIDELAALCEHAHRLGMRTHLDGSRIANAAAWLGVGLRAFTTDVGVDVLSFGGTKNGLMVGEVVVVLNAEAAPGIEYIRKSSMQLASKMRFLSAQFEVLLGTDLWVRSAGHANAMARRLEEAVRDLPGLQVQRPVQANSVFAVLPKAVTARLLERFRFYVWDPITGEVRWMTTFDTTEEDVDVFAGAIKNELAAG